MYIYVKKIKVIIMMVGYIFCVQLHYLCVSTMQYAGLMYMLYALFSIHICTHIYIIHTYLIICLGKCINV